METIGPWIKCKKLGKGGNGEVWKCKHKSNGSFTAVKILKEIKIGSTKYKRFCSEIRLMRTLGQIKYILPLMESNLPPEDTNPPDVPWIAMPIAGSLCNGFSDETSLEEIITGFCNVASTLLELAQKDIHHRDIKPQNLFIFNEEVVIGDFGLATYPDKEALTVEGTKMGPLYYIAPEMMEYRKGVDESRADVYSLAKTLWVLVTGQKYPPPGEQLVTEPMIRISNYVVHTKSYLLDRIVELATRYDPAKRIKLSDFASELCAWGKEGSPITPTMENINRELDDRLQSALVYSISREEKNTIYKQIFEKCKSALITPLQNLKDKIPTLDNVTISLGENLALTGTVGLVIGKDISYPIEGPAIVLCGPGKLHRPLMFSSLGLCDSKQDNTSILAHHVIKIEQVTEPEIVWSDKRDVILGGSTMNLAIDQLITGLRNNLPKALERFVELIEKHKGDIR